LANKLGCKVAELTTVQVDCPKDKIGMVIGKNGAMIKQIQDLTNATIDVRKDDDKIEITGNTFAVAAAVAEIDKIALAVEEEVTVSSEFVNYLTSRHVNVVTKLREQYTDVYLDISRDSTKIAIRGMPDRVNAVKKFLLGIDIVKKERQLIGREAMILVGRKGVTINKLVLKHEVSIAVDKVDEENSTATVTGPPGLVDAAMNEIEELMNDNREVIEKINVSPILKRILLAENAQHIKALQNRVNEELKSQDLDGNTYISFDKDSKEKDYPELLVKAKQSVSSTAFELVEAGVKELDNLMGHFSIDTYIIPRIIGKGGETIRKLTKDKLAYIEVDRVSGKVSVGGTTVEECDAIFKDVKDLIAQNALLRIAVEPALIKTQYRELSRSKTKSELQEIGVWVDSDDDKGQFILRGKEEDLQLGKEKVLTFLAKNYLEEVTITEEDQEALLTGGKESKIMKFSEELGVHLSVDRSRYVVVVRGPAENVKSATSRLNQFLKGGDGHSVARLAVTEDVIGVIIGKGGSTRQQLEQKYDGVSISISKAYNVSIRGPEDKVAACRVEMLKRVSSARVTQIVPVTEEQAVTLEKNNAIKRTIKAVPVQINISDGTAKIRGFFYDVCDAVSLLKEQLTGVYESIIELDAPQFTKVRGATRDPSYLQRMELDTSAKVALDLSAGSLIVSGKRTNVKRAKDQVFGLLDFILPGEMKRLKIPKPLHSSIGQAMSLADISANAGGATVYLDRDLSSIIIRSPDPEKVKIAAGLVEQKIKDGEKLAYVVEVAPSEAAWLLPLIIGKNGAKISLLQKDSGCNIDVSKESRTVTVTGQSEAEVLKVREALDSVVEKARKENVFLSLPEAAIAYFVGKGGKNIKELSSAHGVEIQRIPKGPHSIRVNGQEDAVESAKNAIDEWLIQWEQSNASTMMSVEKQEVGTVLGNKGETARALQEEFGCRIDVDRTTLVVTIRGATEEARENTVNKIKDILEKARPEVAPKPMPEATQTDEPEHTPAPLTKTRSNESLIGTGEEKANRSKEFPANPVGLAGAPKGKKIKKRNSPVDSNIQNGTEAGRNLFQLLASS
jgi:polyribonucleotide nucleotidyltransferase